MQRVFHIHGDSRVGPYGTHFFRDELARLNSTQWPIEIHRLGGAKFHTVCNSASSTITQNPGNITYIMAGINNFTIRHPALHWQQQDYYTFDWVTTEQVACYMEDWMAYLHTKHPGERIILCPLVGAQLNKICVNANIQRQDILNDSIWDINQRIYHINRQACMSTPWISRAVHQSHSHVGRKDTYKQMSDGLHPDQPLQTRWAHILTNHMKSVKTKIETQGYIPI